MMLEKNTISNEMQEELAAILSYWMSQSYDDEFGGFLGARDFFNQKIPFAEKSAVLNARILWTFSAAFNFTKNEHYLKTAHRAYQFLIQHFIDKNYGGLFWSLNHKGEVISTRKQTYAQGFGIYGLSEYYKATKNIDALNHAIDLFELIESKCFDIDSGGYIEAFANNWSPLDDMRLSAKDANFPKSMNTHLHILEPYTNLFRVWKSEKLRDKIAALIQIFVTHIVNSNTNHFELFFNSKWEVKSNIVSYGHDIEGAWLLVEAANEIGNKPLTEQIEKLCIRMVDATIEEGMAADGSVFNEKEGNHLDDDKHWWPQAEALVGLTYAWKISGEKKYLEQMNNTWKFINENIIDKKNGEWFWRVNSKGVPNNNDVKLGFWKCPYHNTRALIEVINLLNTSI